MSYFYDANGRQPDFGFGGCGDDTPLGLRVETLSGAAEMSSQLVDKLSLLAPHAPELVNSVLVVRFFGFHNQL